MWISFSTDNILCGLRFLFFFSWIFYAGYLATQEWHAATARTQLMGLEMWDHTTRAILGTLSGLLGSTKHQNNLLQKFSGTLHTHNENGKWWNIFAPWFHNSSTTFCIFHSLKKIYTFVGEARAVYLHVHDEEIDLTKKCNLKNTFFMYITVTKPEILWNQRKRSPILWEFFSFFCPQAFNRLTQNGHTHWTWSL